MGFIKSLALLIVIPVFGFGISTWVLSDINKSFDAEGVQYTVSEICTAEILSQAPNFGEMCDELAPIMWMKTASIITAIIALMLLMLFIVSAKIAGENRTKIAKIFPPLIFITLIVLSALVLVQGAILTYGAYIGESYAIERVHFYLIGGIALVSLVSGFGLIKSAYNMSRKQKQHVLGKKLDPSKHSKLFSLIKEISDTLGARYPEHVVVGLEPNFYVTSADVNVMGDNTELSGETLYISLPLARILSTEELKAIIGHELGHFRGDDTYYSLKFSPVYSGLSHAIATLGHDNPEESGSIVTLPAYTVLSYMIDVFHKNVSTISREREFAADLAASEVAESKALASSLLKIGLYANAWFELEQRVVERIQAGKATRNLSKLFSGTVKYDVNAESIPEAVKNIAQETITHPTDSHPTTSSRIEALGLNIDDIERDLLNIPEQTCIELFDEANTMEEELTNLQQEYYVAMGVVAGEINNTVSIISAFGAHMVVADGLVEAEEIDKAEKLGLEIDEGFDFVEFRELCQYPDDIPKLEQLFVDCQALLKEDKSKIFNYMKQIATADGNISKEEKQLLIMVKSEFEKVVVDVD